MDMKTAYKILSMRSFLITFVMSLFFTHSVMALTPLFPLANRCEYLFGGTHTLEKVSLTRPAVQSQFQEIWKQFTPEQRSEVQRIIQTLQAGAHREPNLKTRESLQYYLRLLKWSLENNATEFKDPTHTAQARDMYLRLKKAEREFLNTGKSLTPHWADYVGKTLRALQVLSRVKDGPTYENLAQVANDFTLAVSQLYVGPLEVNYIASVERYGANHRLAEEMAANQRRQFEKVMTLAPIAYLRHFKELTLQDFTDSFFFPELKIGILDQPITFDGRTQAGSNGRQVNAYANPAYFYEHDLGNHGSKMIPREFIQPSNSVFDGPSITLTPQNVLRAFRRLQQQYTFHWYLIGKKSTLSHAHRDAVDAILMYLYHEAPEQYFSTAPEFTLQGLQTVLQQKSQDFIGREGLVSDITIQNTLGRINLSNDIGQDLPHLRILPPEKQFDILNQTMQWLLSLKP